MPSVLHQLRRHSPGERADGNAAASMAELPWCSPRRNHLPGRMWAPVTYPDRVLLVRATAADDPSCRVVSQ